MNVPLFIGSIKYTVSFIHPYSRCKFNICRVYADWKFLVLMYLWWSWKRECRHQPVCHTYIYYKYYILFDKFHYCDICLFIFYVVLAVSSLKICVLKKLVIFQIKGLWYVNIQVSWDCKSVHSEFVVCRLFVISVFNRVKIFVRYFLCHAICMMVLCSCSYLAMVIDTYY